MDSFVTSRASSSSAPSPGAIDPLLCLRGIGKSYAAPRALACLCRVLILDEPTAALSSPQVERLLHHVARLRAAGVAIIYISHRLEEVRRIADRITVLRDGRLVATRPASRLELKGSAFGRVNVESAEYR